MVNVALLVRLDAKPGKEADVESFLRGGLSLVQEEPATTAWFAIRMGPSTRHLPCILGRVSPASTSVWSRRCRAGWEAFRAFDTAAHYRKGRYPCSQVALS